MKRTKLFMVAAIVLVLAGLAAVPMADITNFDGLHLSGTFATATPQLLLQNNGTSNSLEIRDGSATPIVYVDADGNATFTGDVDLSSANVSGVVTSTLDTLEVTGDALANTLTITGATALNGGISADTNKFTVADTSGNTYIGGTLHQAGAATFASTVALTQVNAAGAAGNPFDYTGTLGAMTSDDFTLFDINITNADHSGSNTLQVIDIAGITGDAETVESALKIGAGFDSDLNFTTSGEVAVDGNAVAVFKDPPSADGNTTTDLFEVVGTTPVDTAQTNTHNFITVDAAIGASSGGTNNVRGLQIDGVTGDAQVTETGINIDTGWDNALDVNGQNIILGADGGVTLDETSDDVLALTLGAGAATFTVGVGNFNVGSEAPDVAQDGEDVFIEGTLETDGAATLASADVEGALTYGADNLYPMGYASADQQMVCGTTELTETAEIEATGLTAIDYVIATQITTPASTAALLTVSDPTTSTFIASSWEADYSEGTTPVSIHWCAVGDQ